MSPNLPPRPHPFRIPGRRTPAAALAVVGVLALVIPLTAGADADDAVPVITPSLLAAAEASPDASFGVIVQGDEGTPAVAAEIDAVVRESAPVDVSGEPSAPPLEREFVTVSGVATTLTGEQVVALASSAESLVITPDSPMTAADAPVATEAPAIAGIPREGELLTVNDGVWTGSGPFTYSYRWQRCDPAGGACAEIAGATDRSYAVIVADVGSAVRAVVTATASEASGSATSAATAAVAAAPHAAPVAAPPLNSERPVVLGDVETGRPLTATPGVWSGSGALSYSYQWQRCRNPLRSAAMRTPPPVGYWRLGESGGQTAVDASGRGQNGVYGTGVTYGAAGVTEDGDAAVSIHDATASIVAPDVDGGAFVSGFSVEAWVKLAAAQRNRGVIAGGRFENGGGFRLWLDDDGTYGLVVGGLTPVRLRTDALPAVGEWEHLVGTWDGMRLRLYRNGVQIGTEAFHGPLGRSSADLVIGSYPGASESLIGTLDEVAVYDQALPAYRVQSHYLGCDEISGANNKVHWVNAKSIGSRLRVVVTASSSTGSSAAVSELTAVAYARPPVEVSPPAVVGTAEEGQTLTAAVGVWDGTPPFSYTYQWQRCAAGGGGCQDIPGGTGPRYTLGPEAAGTTVRLVVTARNLGGRSSASSSATYEVGAIPTPLPAFRQHWPYTTGIAALHAEAQEALPTIAVVDSGIDASRPDFGGRVIEEVTLTDRTPNSPGDGNGHGTAVASMAAGGAEGYSGAAPKARLVSIDVLDDDGIANTSDVIAAAEWIYANKERLNIRVANFSLHGTSVASLASDPLDKAVERLWLSGIVVVAAAGNYAVSGNESAVPFAPANDPFVLTVGAIDTGGSFTPRDDVAAPWSAWGYTRDGFAKPELAAPGRFITAAVSPDAKLAKEKPERIVEPGYLQLSGTSLAAPIVAGSAAIVLGKHPAWTPDQVKGALMLTAEPLPRATWRSSGVGAVNAPRAAAVADPPNPNLALQPFLVPDPDGGSDPVFDSAAWTQAVESNPAWASVAWGSVAWGSAAWSSVAWGSVAWGSVAWGSVAWGSVAWGSEARNDVRVEGGYWLRRN